MRSTRGLGPSLAVALLLATFGCGRGDDSADRRAATANEPENAVRAEEVVRGVRAYFSRSATEGGGWLQILDPQTSQRVKLQVDRFAPEPSPTGPRSWYLSADMVNDRGFRYVVDFLVHAEQDEVQVSDVLIREVEGDSRYRWVREQGVFVRKRA